MHKFPCPKPLYRYELNKDYLKHKKKLTEIRNKLIYTPQHTQSLEIGSRIK